MSARSRPTALLEAVLTRTGLDVDVARAGAELEGLVAGPWAAYEADPDGRRFALTESGAPFELSVKVAADGEMSIRYVVDVADHTRDLAGNAARYLQAAESATGLSEEVVGALMTRHLHDAPPGSLANVMVGVGWAAGNRRRSTIYLPAGWLDAGSLDRRLPEPTGLDQPAQVVGYDVEDAGLSSWKTYHWFAVDPTAPPAGRDLLPELALRVYDQFAARVVPAARERAAFRQRRLVAGAAQDRLFLFTRLWQLTDGPELLSLLTLLAGVGLDLGVLRAVAAMAREHGMGMHLGMVAVGGHGIPSATFYFWPRGPGVSLKWAQ